MTLKNGKTWEYPNVPEEIARKCIYGEASCTTDDDSGRKRWWVGKNPSLGAAYWTYIRKHYTSQLTTNEEIIKAFHGISIAGTDIRNKLGDVHELPKYPALAARGKNFWSAPPQPHAKAEWHGNGRRIPGSR